MTEPTISYISGDLLKKTQNAVFSRLHGLRRFFRWVLLASIEKGIRIRGCNTRGRVM